MMDLVVPGFTVSGVGPAAALAVLDLHTSDDPSPAGVGPTTTEPAAITPKRGCGCLPRWLAWTLLLAIGGLAVFSGACLDACTGSNRIRHVPTIHGRVVDMETGQPLAGVRITRYFVRNEFGGPGGGDQSIAPGSWYTATSSADGTFELPGWWGLARGISSIKWGEFKPGWTAAWGTIILNHAPTLDIAKNYPSANGVVAETRPGRSHSAMILRLHRVDNPMAAADHFWAMRILVEDRIIQKQAFVTQAAAYLATNGLTEEMIGDIASLVPSGPCSTPYCRDPRIRILARAIVTYCEHTPTSAYCEPRTGVMIRQLREWLEKEHIDGE
jgi:hypothetical protein